MTSIRQAGKHPEEAAALLWRSLAEGTLLGRAEHILTKDADGTTEHRDHVVPAGILALSPMPPLGHDFWCKGDILVQPDPIPEGSVVRIGGQIIPCPLGGLLPVFVIRGHQVSRDGVLALCRAIGGGKGRGRPKGAGSLAEEDAALVLEMHELVRNRIVGSPNQAAFRVVSKAAGGGTTASKIKRLVGRYYERFPRP